MKKLIILTGISGVGKTTLSEYIRRKINNVTVITLDIIFEQICELIGFDNEKEKQRNRTIAVNCFKKVLEECMKREDEIIVIDYPFESNWEKFFNRISYKYNYDVLTVKMYGETFEKIYERACARDLSNERSIIHEIDYYNPNEDKNINRRKVQPEGLLKEIYENESSTSFTIGKELKFINKDKTTLEKCFIKIKEWILEK